MQGIDYIPDVFPAAWAHSTEVVPVVRTAGQIGCQTFRGLCDCLEFSDEMLTEDDAREWGKQHLASL